MIRYVKYQNNQSGSVAFGKWYLRAVCDEQVDVDGLADHMSAHSSPYSKGTIKGILVDAVACVKELMLEGKSVKFADLAIFKLGLICTGADTREEAKVSNVTGIRFNAKATGEMSVAQLRSEIKLRELKEYTVDSDDDDDPGNGGGSNVDPGAGGGGGGQQQTPVKYRITFKFADNTEDDHEYEAGDTINYPTPSSGYQWPSSKPSVMLAEDVTVTEVVIPGGGGGSGF